MKNKREIYKALLDGKKITHNSWDSPLFIYIDKNSDLVDQDNSIYNDGFEYIENWHIYCEHFDLKKAVELHGKGYKIKRENGYLIFDSGTDLYKLYKDDILATDYYIIEETEQKGADL